MRTQSHYSRGRWAVWAGGALGVGAAVLSSNAQVSLTDGNASVDINPNSQAGAYNWFVDNMDQLTQQWYWYRVGNTAEASIDTLSYGGVTTSGNNQAVLSYSGVGFTLQLTYSLLGGSAGSGASDLAEQLRVVNTSGNALDFHLFLYADFDLGGTAGGDTVSNVTYAPFPISAPGFNSVIQEDATGFTTKFTQQTTFGTFANRAEAEAFPNTLNKLNDGSDTSLLNAGASFGPVGPGDMTYAFQWDLNLAAGGSKVIAVDKRISIQVIPEPTTAALGLLGLAALAGTLRKRI